MSANTARRRLGKAVNRIEIFRHCEEPTGHANARPMTGFATTQSIYSRVEAWIASLRSQ
jgi:hypothetical protein